MCAATVTAGLVGYLVREFELDEGRPGNNDAGGQVFVIVSGMHAVVLGFVMVTLFDSVGTAREGTYQEARDLVAVAWTADALPELTGQQVHELTASYARTGVGGGWPDMRTETAVSDEG